MPATWVVRIKLFTCIKFPAPCLEYNQPSIRFRVGFPQPEPDPTPSTTRLQAHGLISLYAKCWCSRAGKYLETGEYEDRNEEEGGFHVGGDTFGEAFKQKGVTWNRKRKGE